MTPGRAAAASERDTVQPFHLLHVEDDELDALNVQRLLRGSTRVAAVEVAHDGVEALVRLRSGAISMHRLVVLLDIRMPRMNGLEFLAELRADPALRHLPVVVMTTSQDAADLAGAYRHCIAGYLVKSNDREQFRRALEAFEEYWARVLLP